MIWYLEVLEAKNFSETQDLDMRNWRIYQASVALKDKRQQLIKVTSPQRQGRRNQIEVKI